MLISIVHKILVKYSVNEIFEVEKTLFSLICRLHTDTDMGNREVH